MATIGRLICLATLFSAGCASMSETGKGVVGGSLIGSAVGTGIGFATGNPRAGAAIGGLAGAGIGGAVGSEKDEQQRERTDAIRLAEAQVEAGRVSRGPLSIADVIGMGRPDPTTGRVISDDVIIGTIRSTGSQYNLSPQDLRELSNAGVSDKVVQEMLNTRHREPAAVRVVRPGPPPVVYVDRPVPVDPFYYGPPVFVRPYGPPVRPGFGFSYTRVGH